jgi:hypothetical protein
LTSSRLTAQQRAGARKRDLPQGGRHAGFVPLGELAGGGTAVACADHVHDSSAGRAAIAAIFTATGALISEPQVMGLTHHRRDTSVRIVVGFLTLVAIAVSAVELLWVRTVQSR